MRVVSAPSSCRRRSAGAGSVTVLASAPPSVDAAAWRRLPLQPLTATEPAAAAETRATTIHFVEPRWPGQVGSPVDSSGYYSFEINL